MQLCVIDRQFTVCKIKDLSLVDWSADFLFIARTDEELSLVCETSDTPDNTTEREDGWRAFRIAGTLNFSLIGILSKISALLADAKIGIFAISTYNTDYILVRSGDLEQALTVLKAAGYTVI